MIYIGKVIPATMNSQIDLPMIDFLIQYKPQKIKVPTEELDQRKVKTTILNGFISGEMKSEIRKNENVSTRDCLLLDLDSVSVSAEELKQEIVRRFSKYDYALFPSVSNGIKGVRYRLVLPIDKNVHSEEYSLLIRFFLSKVLGTCVNQIDESNVTWSQIQLLPVITQFSSQEDIIINQTDKQLKTKLLVKASREYFKDVDKENETKTYENTSNRQQRKLYTGEFLDLLVKGAEIGNRNNWLRKMTDKMLGVGAELTTIYQFLMVVNHSFLDEPISDNELNAIFKSRVKNHNRKRG